MKKARLAVGALGLLLVLLAASMVPGAGAADVEASAANQIELIEGSNAQDAPAKRGGRGKGRWSLISSSSEEDDDGFGFSGRRYSGD